MQVINLNLLSFKVVHDNKFTFYKKITEKKSVQREFHLM